MTKAITQTKLVCSDCDEEIYQCDCGNYFHVDSEIECYESEHYHKGCEPK